jgi:hypothetical protein
VLCSRRSRNPEDIPASGGQRRPESRRSAAPLAGTGSPESPAKIANAEPDHGILCQRVRSWLTRSARVRKVSTPPVHRSIPLTLTPEPLSSHFNRRVREGSSQHARNRQSSKSVHDTPPTSSHRKLIGEAAACRAAHGEFDSHPVLHRGCGRMVRHRSRVPALLRDGGSIPPPAAISLESTRMWIPTGLESRNPARVAVRLGCSPPAGRASLCPCLHYRAGKDIQIVPIKGSNSTIQ